MSSLDPELFDDPPPKKIHKPIDVSTLVITALLFFVILAWYTFFVHLYRYLIGYNPDHPDEDLEVIKKSALASLGYALLWTGLTLVIYLCFRSRNDRRSR